MGPLPRSVTDAYIRGFRKLPPAVRLALPDSFAIKQCAVNLWKRSQAGPEGRVVMVTDSAAPATVMGSVVVAKAADMLVEAKILEELKSLDGLRIWRWLVAEEQTTSHARGGVSPIKGKDLSVAERARIETLRPR